MKTKKKLLDRDLDFLLFECEMHRLLDLLQAPAGRYLVKRLREYLESKGIDTSWEVEANRLIVNDPEFVKCSTCGTVFRRGCMCGHCYGGKQ